jgi:hypothetical protein
MDNGISSMSRACHTENGATEGSEAPEAGQPDPPEPRKRGRPKGTPKTGGRTKAPPLTAPEIRDALLGKSNAIEELCKIAKGEQMRWSGPTGKVVWRYPTAQEQISALRLIIDKTVPTLQATQLSGDPEAPLIPTPPPDSLDLARVVLGVLREAAPDRANVSVSGPDEHIARFRDSDLGRILMGDGYAPAAGKFPEFEPPAPTQPEPAPKVGPARLAEVGETELIGDRGFFIQLRERRDVRERWGIADPSGHLHRMTWCTRDEAIQFCQEIEQASAGKLYAGPDSRGAGS